MKHGVEMDSGALIHTKFHKDRFKRSEVDKGIHSHMDNMEIA
jgi:hypothetical protein